MMAIKTKLVITLSGVLLLSSCGVKRDLKPQLGHALPIAPYGRATAPTAADLLAPGPQDQPSRSVELRTKSEPRTDDPFDLPPKE